LQAAAGLHAVFGRMKGRPVTPAKASGPGNGFKGFEFAFDKAGDLRQSG
jgi:hypothetical protein